jgi:hypothetical protein
MVVRAVHVTLAVGEDASHGVPVNGWSAVHVVAGARELCGSASSPPILYILAHTGCLDGIGCCPRTGRGARRSGDRDVVDGVDGAAGKPPGRAGQRET